MLTSKMCFNSGRYPINKPIECYSEKTQTFFETQGTDNNRQRKTTQLGKPEKTGKSEKIKKKTIIGFFLNECTGDIKFGCSSGLKRYAH